MLKMELNRIGNRPIFWILILAGLIYALIPVVNTWPKGVSDDFYVFYPRSAFVSWMYFIGDTYLVYSLTFPLLASLAYSDAYAEDFNSGLIKSVLTKVEKGKYLTIRYFVNFMIGGLVAVFPLIINFIGEMAAYPLIENNYYFGMPLVIQGSFWPELFYNHPILYILLRLFILFLFGGMLASIGLAVSTFVKNRYIVLIVPFLLVLGIDVLSSAIGILSLSLLFLGNVETTWEIPVILFVGIFGSFVWYYTVGGRNETI